MNLVRFGNKWINLDQVTRITHYHKTPAAERERQNRTGEPAWYERERLDFAFQYEEEIESIDSSEPGFRQFLAALNDGTFLGVLS